MTTNEFCNQFEELRSPLMTFAVRLTHNKEDAGDLLQETMGKAFRHIESFKVGTNFRAWLVTIMRNLFINQYRKKKVRNMQIEPIDNHLYSLEKSGVSNGGESSMMVQEIYKAISNLDKGYSLPFQMHYQGYKYDEIAERLDVPLGTVKSRIFFARRALKEMIHRQFGDLHTAKAV